MQATTFRLGATSSPVLRVPRVKRRHQGVSVELGESQSGDHVEVVLLPVEVEDELEDGTGSGDGAGFDCIADEAAKDLVRGGEAGARFSQLFLRERSRGELNVIKERTDGGREER